MLWQAAVSDMFGEMTNELQVRQHFYMTVQISLRVRWKRPCGISGQEPTIRREAKERIWSAYSTDHGISRL